MVAVDHIKTFTPTLISYLSRIVFAIIGHKLERKRLANFVLQLEEGLILFFVLLDIHDFNCRNSYQRVRILCREIMFYQLFGLPTCNGWQIE
tara:strand:+ start:1890 stop:2165 length:276 start_codon:yes stop_codon:yes gene_type:complete